MKFFKRITKMLIALSWVVVAGVAVIWLLYTAYYFLTCLQLNPTASMCTFSSGSGDFLYVVMGPFFLGFLAIVASGLTAVLGGITWLLEKRFSTK